LFTPLIITGDAIAVPKIVVFASVEGTRAEKSGVQPPEISTFDARTNGELNSPTATRITRTPFATALA